MEIGKNLSVLDYKGKKKINLYDEVKSSKIYVEPFGGSFNAGFNLLASGYTGKVIYNDLDKELVDFWNRVKSGNINLETDETWLKYRGNRGITNNTFEKLLNNIEWLQQVEILNMKYQEVLQLYNREEVYMFIDPPYIMQSKYNCGVDHVKLADEIRKLRCKWLLTYNDRPEVHDMYKEFSIEETSRTLYKKKYTELYIRGNRYE